MDYFYDSVQTLPPFPFVVYLVPTLCHLAGGALFLALARSVLCIAFDIVVVSYHIPAFDISLDTSQNVAEDLLPLALAPPRSVLGIASDIVVVVPALAHALFSDNVVGIAGTSLLGL